MACGPKVTIAVPTYNRAAYLGVAVKSALEQSYENIEVVIADNGSSDSTPEVVKGLRDPRVRCYRHEKNHGLVYNWNFCLDTAEGELFLMLSDDDIMERDAVKWLAAQFENPEVVLAYSSVLYINEHTQPVKISRNTAPPVEPGRDFILNRLKGQRGWMPSATLHRTEAARQAGGYPPVGTATDMALCLLIALDGTVHFNPRPLVKYRVHESNVSNGLQRVIESHEILMEWAGKPQCPLFEYSEQIKQYCVEFIFDMALSEARKMSRESSLTAMRAVRRLSPHWKKEFIFRLYNFPPAQHAAVFRRNLRSKLSSNSSL